MLKSPLIKQVERKKKRLKKAIILIVLIYGLVSAAIPENTGDIYTRYDARD